MRAGDDIYILKRFGPKRFRLKSLTASSSSFSTIAQGTICNPVHTAVTLSLQQGIKPVPAPGTQYIIAKDGH